MQNQRNMVTEFSLNKFADLNKEEFAKKYLRLRPNTNKIRKFGDLSEVQVHEKVDWVEKGGVTSIKDQGTCGSCWAFSAVAALECAYWQTTGKLVSFSEQQLIDCSISYGNYGCNGGMMDYAFDYYLEHEAMYDDGYPYLEQDSWCKEDPDEGICKINSYVDVQPNEEALKRAVNKKVVSVAVDASNWQFYSGGIFNDDYCSEYNLNHGVSLVGYGIDLAGQSYWKIKNSWDGWWGEQGYIRLARTDKIMSTGQCGIAVVASYPLL